MNRLPSRLRIQEQPMQQFHRQEFMDFVGVVAVPAQMSLHGGFNAFAVKVRPRKGAGVEQHLSYVFGQSITVPDAEMRKLMPAEK